YQSAPGWSSYDNFVYDFCLGVEEHDPAAFKVWPNPVEDVFNVQCTMNNVQLGMRTIEVFDVYGKLVRTETVTDSPARVNVSDLRAGVYLLRVTAADGKEYHQKIVKR
ncbi:MAG: T9SS type A sorting domain-containing protein, partial [Bacteroidales bacterium]|nr:T9SS type A sorting domain-containing protein [Bacteroidales bacterium]